MLNLSSYYEWFKAFHVFSVICWMVGLLYLPRLYVYHAKATIGSEMDKTFQLMEKRLLRIIMNPAMIVTYIFGMINSYIYGILALGVWFHIKITAVLGLTVLHGLLAKWRRNFELGQNVYSANFYRIINEIPAILMLVAIIMVIVKPFD